MSDPALDRAMVMMQTPAVELPSGTLAGARVLYREVGICMDTYITSYAWYAQYVEKLKYEDAVYMFQGHVTWKKAVNEAIQRDLPGKAKLEVIL